MFVINQSQLRRLARPGLVEFINKLQQFIGTEYPEEVLLEDPKQVRQRLTELVDKAQRYGFVLEQQVTLFVCICMELGDDFDQQLKYEPVTTILSDGNSLPQDRIDRAGELVFS
ncbi:MAG: hypothetical protein H7319_04065 [Spirosoma sp.]|nr:hypothetical protein [Spirosoma sp.]